MRPTTSDDAVQMSGKGLAAVLPGACRRCFWIQLHYPVPFRGGFPGIFNSIDSFTKRVVHHHFDAHGDLPDWFPNIGFVADYVRDGGRLGSRRFRIYDQKTKVTLTGVPDDVFVMKDGSYHIVDYKTARLTNTQDELFPTYEVQLNAYAYIAERVGLGPVRGLSLIYMEPQSESVSILENRPALKFEAKLVKVKVRPDQIVPPLLEALHALYVASMPPARTEGCEDCEKLEGLLRGLA